MADNEELPTIGEAISQWLGVRLPTIPLPQTRKNIDKALGKLVLAVGENLEARIRGSTNKTKAKDKIDVAGMFRTEEERRKLENRAAAERAYRARNTRITTAELNRFFDRALAQPRASTPTKHQVKVLYLTQGSVSPPTSVQARPVTIPTRSSSSASPYR